MRTGLSSAELEKALIRCVKKESGQLNDFFGSHTKTFCKNIMVRMKQCLDSENVTGIASFSGKIFFEAHYYSQLLAGIGFPNVSGAGCDTVGDILREFARGLLLHEYSHLILPPELKDIYSDPRFDNSRKREIFIASAAVVEDMASDAYLQKIYAGEYCASLRIARNILAQAAARSGVLNKDPLLCAAIRLLLPDFGSVPENETSDRIVKLFQKANAQKTPEGKLHFVRQIADIMDSDGRYYISDMFKLIVCGYETHFLEYCRDYVGENRRLVKFQKPSVDGNEKSYQPQSTGASLHKDVEASLNGSGASASATSDIGEDPAGTGQGFKSSEGLEIAEDSRSRNGQDDLDDTGDSDDMDEFEDEGDPDNIDDSDGANDSDEIEDSWLFPGKSGLVVEKYDLNFTPRDMFIYKKIIKIYSALIKNYTSRIQKLITPELTETEDRLLFGSGIASSRLFDVKKRYWYMKRGETNEPPKIDVSIMVHCSDRKCQFSDPELVFGNNSFIPQRYLAYGLAVVSEVLEKCEIPLSIAYADSDGRVTRIKPIQDPRYADSKNVIGRFLTDSSKCSLSRLEWEKQEFAVISDMSKIIAADYYGDRHIMIFLSDSEWNEKSIQRVTFTYGFVPFQIYGYRVKLDDSFIIPERDMKSVFKIENSRLQAIALDYNNEEGSKCYPSLRKALPKVQQCDSQEEFPRMLLGMIYKMLSGFIQ